MQDIDVCIMSLNLQGEVAALCIMALGQASVGNGQIDCVPCWVGQSQDCGCGQQQTIHG